MIGSMTSLRVSRTIEATWSRFQPRVIADIATRSFSIFSSSAPTSMKTTCAYKLLTIDRRDKRPSR